MEIHTPGAALFYQKTGHGSRPMLLFHGFGQTHQTLNALAHALSEKYTCYIFDLYFHGESTWANPDVPLEKTAWKHIITTFLTTEGIASFSLLGYSLGGKFALATLEALPARTLEIFLIAPDGIKNNLWYTLATAPALTRRFFKSMVTYPDRFFRLTRFFQQLRIIDPGLLRFAMHQMNTAEKRERVYASWVVFRRLKFNMSNLARVVNQYNIPFVVMLGEDDKVILAGAVKKLLGNIRSLRLQVLKTDHHRLLQSIATDSERYFTGP